MKAKLIKENNFYKLIQNNTILVKISTNESINIHYSFGKLSLKNCQLVERDYDLDELADKYEYVNYKGKSKSYNIGFKHGFQKALELMGNKMYTADNIVDAYMAGHLRGMSTDMGENNIHPICSEHLNSLQQTEWDVEIVMEYVGKIKLNKLHEMKPKLDEDGCLILKRK